MKKIKKSLFVLTVMLVTIIIGISWWWYLDHSYYANFIDSSNDVKKWEADPRPLQTESEVNTQLASLRQNTKWEAQLLRNHKLIVIPGLRGAWSINHATGKAAFSNNWVPQGVASSDNHFYISMYDGNHKLNSIITQIDAETSKYVKSLILSSKAHVGGIAYDGQRKRLFWSNDKGSINGGGLSYTSQNSIDAYDASKSHAPIKENRIPWQHSDRTSAITFYHDQLVVVRYGQNTNKHSIVAVPLNSEGLPPAITDSQFRKIVSEIPNNISIEKYFKAYMTKLIDAKLINSYAPGWDRLQGIAIAKNGVTLLSQSNGSALGKIWIQFPNDRGWSKLSFTAPKSGAKVINVPNSVEEVSLNSEGDHVAMVFESGAKVYRETNYFFNRPQFMDRILILKANKSDFRAS